MRKLLFLFVIIILMSICVSQGMAQSIQKIGDNAKIDWTNLVYYAEGDGAVAKPDVIPNRAIALLKAKDYAKMAAIANLLMAIEGTSISYESTGKDYMADTTIRQKIEGYVKNVQVVETRYEVVEGDKIVTVKVKAPMFGTNAPGTLFLNEEKANIIQENTQKPLESTVQPTVNPETDINVVLKPDNPKVIKPAPAQVEATTIDPSAPDVMAIAKPSAIGNPYTGLIIDATGYKLDRAMSPKIRKADGTEIWGSINVDADLLLDKGIVSYATSMESAKKNARAGSNPLVIRAIGRAGGKFYSDPIISNGDATVLIYENGKSHFLDKLNVVFIKDPKTY